MLIEEAYWLADRIAELDLRRGDIAVDVGSSTAEFRCVVQPHIDYLIFRPLRERGICVVHMDSKDALDVDVVADIASPDADLGELKHAARLVLCTNLLEHVVNRNAVVGNLIKLLNSTGHLMVTVPFRYPYHGDPIDTMYRPSTDQLIDDLGPAVVATRADVIEALPGIVCISDGPTWRVAAKMARFVGYRVRRRLTMPQMCLVSAVVAEARSPS